MSSYRVVNLSRENLVAAELLAAPDSAEWREVTPPLDDEFDATGTSNLLVRCTTCGMAVREGQSGVLMCPDCGEENFSVQELRVRYLWDLPGLAIRVTGKSPREFLHIDVPAELKEAHEIYYTLDGSEPTRRSLLYRHPIMLRPPVYTMRAMVQFGDYQSQTVEHVHKKLPMEYAYDCPVCGRRVSGTTNVLFCPQCHYRRVFYESGNYAEYGIDLRCEVCGATVTATTGSVSCARCGCGYSFSKTGKWRNKGLGVRCGNCQSVCTVFRNLASCPKCHYTFRYKLSTRSWNSLPPHTASTGVPGATPPFTSPPHPRPSDHHRPRGRRVRPVDAPLSEDVAKILQFIFFLLVLLGISYCSS